MLQIVQRFLEGAVNPGGWLAPISSSGVPSASSCSSPLIPGDALVLVPDCSVSKLIQCRQKQNASLTNLPLPYFPCLQFTTVTFFYNGPISPCLLWIELKSAVVLRV